MALLAKKLGQQDEQAEPLLRAAQGQHPEDFWLNYALGEALRERKPAEAVGFYRAALAMRPTAAEVHLEVSVALERQGQVDEAIRACRKALELEPTDGRYHYYLGSCLRARGRLDEAMAEFRRAIELDPTGAPAHYGLGVCLYVQRRLDEAMAEYRRAIQLDPGGSPAHCSLGMCCQDKGQLDEAMAEYRRAIELDPKAAIFWGRLIFSVAALCVEGRPRSGRSIAASATSHKIRNGSSHPRRYASGCRFRRLGATHFIPVFQASTGSIGSELSLD